MANGRETGYRLPTPKIRFGDQKRWTSDIGRMLDDALNGFEKSLLGHPRMHGNLHAPGGSDPIAGEGSDDAEFLALSNRMRGC